MSTRNFIHLRVWQEAHQLTVQIYVLSKNFPTQECYGLTQQVRRAAASVGANIAEGMGRSTQADFKRFLIMARGSVQEMVNHLILADDLNYLTHLSARNLISRYDGLNAGIDALIKSIS